MINNTGQLHFGGVSSKVVCLVSFGGVVLFYPDLQVYTDFTCNTAKCFHQNAKSQWQLGGPRISHILSARLPLPELTSHRAHPFLKIQEDRDVGT